VEYVDRLAGLSSKLDVLITTVVDTANVATHEAIPGINHVEVTTSNWLWGHFPVWGWSSVHDNILEEPLSWVAYVGW